MGVFAIRPGVVIVGRPYLLPFPGGGGGYCSLVAERARRRDIIGMVSFFSDGCCCTLS